MTTRFLWIRHFPLSATGTYIGQSDVEAIIPPLSTPDSLAISGIDNAVWLTSPLIRARQTMDWMRQSLQLHGGEVMSVPELMEQSFGQWEGQRYDYISIDSTHPETIQPPGGETFLDLSERVHAWLDKALELYTGQTIIVVCHAGVIRCSLAHALAIPAASALRFQIDYASFTETSYVRHDNKFIGCVKASRSLLVTKEQLLRQPVP